MFAALMATMLLAAVDPSTSTDAPATSAAPTPPPAAAAPPAQAKRGKDPDVVCWSEMPTGSHFAKRVCATREQLELNQRTSQEAMHGRASGPKGGFGPS